ncbi:MAG: CDP-alcohol phosphatidyltransferase family protein [Christensenella sp.]|jgi:cardiolipin synthase|nr:CDP-alcohol phosphatidyltransferase family protein [Christensenella sp.]
MEVFVIGQIPNILSMLRIGISFLLFAFKPFSAPFFVLYLIGGITDAADGFLARKLHAQTRLGSALDSVADFVFFFTVLLLFSPYLPDTAAAYAALYSILLLKLATLCIGILKYRKLPFLHTYANKAAGIALFAFPFLYVCTDIWIAFSVIAIIAGIAAFEELIITLKCPDFVPDRKGLAMRSAGGRSSRQ